MKNHKDLSWSFSAIDGDESAHVSAYHQEQIDRNAKQFVEMGELVAYVVLRRKSPELMKRLSPKWREVDILASFAYESDAYAYIDICRFDGFIEPDYTEAWVERTFVQPGCYQ